MNGENRGARTILIVEDNHDIRRMLKLLLESEHFLVLEAANGAEALNAVNQEHPDLILTDLELPKVDGFETIRRLRKIDGFQNTPIIVLSAHSEPAICEAAERAGSNYFLTKPVDFDELMWLLEDLLVNGNGKTAKQRSPAQRVRMNKQLLSRPGSREFAAL